MTDPVITDPNDPNYDPSVDPNFMNNVLPGSGDEQAAAAEEPAPPAVGDPAALNGGATVLVGTDHPRGIDGLPEKVDGVEVAVQSEFGYHPSGTPKTAEDVAAEENPKCPAVSLGDGPFDGTTIYAGTNEPLTPECVAYLNAQRVAAGYVD